MKRKKNILLITADQLRADALGCYGNPVCQTPNLDNLADSGIRFANAMTPNPICVPARASITTGNYSHRATGNKNNEGRIRDDQPKLAEHFRQAGYRTYACGKLHYLPYSGPGEPRLTHGFDVWDSNESGRIVSQHDPHNIHEGLEDYIDDLAKAGWAGYSRAHGVGNNDVRPCPTPLPEDLHPDHWVADCTIRRLREHNHRHTDQPFLLWCSFPKPHAPLDPPAEYAQMYDPRDVPAPIDDESLLSDRAPHLEAIRRSHALDSLSPAARRVARAYYYGLVSFQDTQVGRVLETLNSLGLMDDTIIIYTADHGDLMGDFGTFFKCSFLNGSLRVPMMIAGPGVKTAESCENFVGLQDIFPTLAGLTGCDLPQDVHGLDLTTTLSGNSASKRERFYAQCLQAPKQTAMITDGQWKYCYAQQGPTEELYNLIDDPEERNNLAPASKPAALRQWRNILIDEARRVGDDDLLDSATATGLAESPFDRSELVNTARAGMGWRWY